jgi:hypothetical protein
MTLRPADILWLTLMFCVIAWGIDNSANRQDEEHYGIDFLINVQSTAYEKGLKEGSKYGKIATVYLCRDWIPLLGYKAWRQCNMDYVAQEESEHDY